MKSRLLGAIWIFVFLTTSFHSQTTSASFITEIYAGEISFVFEAEGFANPFGVVVGDSIFVTVTYDDSLVSQSGESIVEFGLLDGQKLLLKIGSQTFDEQGDIDYGSGYPRLTFFDEALVGIDYAHPWHDLGSGRGVFMGGNKLEARDGWWDDQNWELVVDWEVQGQFDFTNPIPLPPAVLLFGSGLLGMIGIARRKKAA